jgi:serine/threonine protein kinase
MSEWIGRYRILRPLGEGGMGRTFLGEVAGPSGFCRRVVLKQVKDDLDAGLKQALLDEARLVASLVHRNIVPVLDLEESGERRLVVLEHVDGIDLQQLLERRKRLPWPLAVFIASEVAAGLDYAHRKSDAAGRPLSIVHRDVSPANILLSWEGEVKLTDFGVAKFARSGEGWGLVAGKPGYMAPEQARADVVDARADLFALGVTLYEMVAGANPLLKAAPLLPLADVPRELHGVVERATAEEPRLRIATAAAMRSALLGIAGLPNDPAHHLAAFLRESRGAPELKPEALYEAVLGGGRPLTQVKPAETVIEPPRLPASASRRPRLTWLIATSLVLSLVTGALAAWRARRTMQALPAVASRSTAPTAAATSARPAAAPAAKPHAERPHPARGTLSINAIPWANVFIDGRSVGHTPRVGIALDAGHHQLRLTTRGGDTRTRTIDIPPGRELKVTINFAEP